MNLERANQIVDRISALAETGLFNKLVPLSRVGVSTTFEALQALYLVTAETYRDVAREETTEAKDMLRSFIRSAGGTAMWIVSSFHPDGDPRRPVEYDERVKRAETIDSFVGFLKTVGIEYRQYWPSVYERIGLPYPESTPQKKPSLWRKLLGS